jgi:hypothetical protein
MTHTTSSQTSLSASISLETLLDGSQSRAGRATDRNPEVLLWWARQNQRTQGTALQFLVAHGYDALAHKFLDQVGEAWVGGWRDDKGASLLHAAIVGSLSDNRDPEALGMARRVLEAGGGLALNATDDQGRTPLACAAEAGHLPLVRFLILVGADPDVARAPNITTEGVERAAYDRLRGSALERAARAGHAEVVEALLYAGADATLIDFDALLKPGAGSVPQPILTALRTARDLRRLGTAQRLRAVDFNQDTGDARLHIPPHLRKLDERQIDALKALRSDLEGSLTLLEGVGRPRGVDSSERDEPVDPVARVKPR